MLLVLRKTLQFNDGVPIIRKKKQTMKVEKIWGQKMGKYKINLFQKFTIMMLIPVVQYLTEHVLSTK